MDITQFRNKGGNQPYNDFNSTRKWIHRFNEKGLEGLASKIHMHKSIGISGDMEKKTVDIAAKNPREGYGPPFSTWSLRALAAAYLFDQNSI